MEAGKSEGLNFSTVASVDAIVEVRELKGLLVAVERMIVSSVPYRVWQRLQWGGEERFDHSNCVLRGVFFINEIT